jgi:hypothetical protein
MVSLGLSWGLRAKLDNYLLTKPKYSVFPLRNTLYLDGGLLYVCN